MSVSELVAESLTVISCDDKARAIVLFFIVLFSSVTCMGLLFTSTKWSSTRIFPSAMTAETDGNYVIPGI